MIKIILPFFIVLILLFFSFFFTQTPKKNTKNSVDISSEIQEKPLDKYSFENLKVTRFNASDITVGRSLKDELDFKSVMFYFSTNGKRVSGLLNVPKEPGNYPVVVMFRGYVDREEYLTGVGTSHMGEFLAKKGFITLACDFLGYGESDNPSENPIEERFQTYTTALNLIESLVNLNQALAVNDPEIKADTEKVGIWGHSNGGHIALAVLEITGGSFPTVLWAPVSKPFPYSILYYTDEFDDHGKMLRKVVADFEKDYDSEKYSLTNFLDLINVPIQLHQGGQDEAVPVKWSDQLADTLKRMDKKITYFTYPGEDHDFSKGNWPVVASRSAEFYRSYFKKSAN